MLSPTVNPYRGINAHLHSFAQNPGENSPTIWTSFHTSHIGDIVNMLNENLPLNYLARPEQSLQIWTAPTEDDKPASRRSPRPDVGISRTSVTDSTINPLPDNSDVRIIELDKYLELEITIPSAVIYEVKDHELAGTPVTRIELLSASNKHGGTGNSGYITNRYAALHSGTSLIELDYLHESISPLPRIPIYPNAPDSHPYYIAMTDRRPGERQKHQMIVHVIDVDMPLAQNVLIPLAGNDTIRFDFDAAYQFTFRAGRWVTNINYAELPRNFDSYSAPDQERIHQVMQRPQNPG